MKKLTTMCVLAGALMLTSCSMVEDEEIPAEELYTRSFIKAFGVIDPKQDWNMATQLTANVNISSLPSSTYRVRVYTANPINPDSRLMADYTLSKSSPSSFKFDALKGATEVFVTAEGSEGLAINGYYAVSNNTVSIGGETRAMTRSASDVTKKENGTKTFTTYYPNDDHFPTVDVHYNLEEAKKLGDTKYIALVKSEEVTDETTGKTTYTCTWEDINGKQYTTTSTKSMDDAKAEWQTRALGFYYNSETANKRLMKAQTYTQLSGVEHSEGITMKVRDYIHLFGASGYYPEQATPSNLETYKDRFNPDVTFKVTGEVTLDYIYGNTEHRNVFGYYYWQDGEDPIKAVRYVLIDNAKPSNNLTITNNGSTTAVTDKGMDNYFNDETKLDAIITGTKYKIPYFNSDGTATYTFPDNTHIAFFLVVNGIDGLDSGMSNWIYNTNLSVRSHNYEAFMRTFSGYKRDDSDGDTSVGEIDAIAFKDGGQTFLSFEDRGGDKDMNDIVFIVNGAEAEHEIPTNDSETKTHSWTIACEDLGSTDDYDFNDVVMNISYVSSNTDPKLTATPLAAGGVYKTEVYFGEKLLGEIHDLIDKKGPRTTGSYPMLNTTSKGTAGDEIDLKEYLTEEQKTALTNGTFSLSYDEAKQQNMAGFSIKVYKSESDNATDAVTITAPDRVGIVPQMFLVDGSWAWPTERTDIANAYAKEGYTFSNWVKDSKNTDWWNHPSGSVVK